MRTLREVVADLLTLLIGYIVRDLEQVDVADRHPHVLGLTTSKATREVGVAEHAGGLRTVHGALGGVGVCLFALRG